MFKEVFIKKLEAIGLPEEQSSVFLLFFNNNELTLEKIENSFSKKYLKIQEKTILEIVKSLIKLELIYEIKNPDNKSIFKLLGLDNLKKLKNSNKIPSNSLKLLIKNLNNKLLLLNNNFEVLFLKNKEGFNIVSDNMLTSKTPIRAFINPDINFTDSFIIENNKNNLEQRKKRKILKNILLFKGPKDSYFLNKNKNEITDIKILNNKTKSNTFTYMYIYDNKIVYINYLKKDNITLVVINNQDIYTVNKEIFDIEWNSL